jgi:hypothetical protein
MIEQDIRIPWKCATTAYHLDEELMERMAAAGCVRISIGVETLEEDAATTLPHAKQSPTTSLDNVASWSQRYGIELNCFVIIGLPGTTVAGTRATIQRIAQAGARARPTLYTPYHLMNGAMTEREVSAFNRHLFVASGARDDEETLALLDFIFGDDGYITPSTEKIPKAVHTLFNQEADRSV